MARTKKETSVEEVNLSDVETKAQETQDLVWVMEKNTKKVVKIDVNKNPNWKKEYLHRSGVPFTE